MLLEFQDIDELKKWLETHSRPYDRFACYTNLKEGKLLTNEGFVLVRPSVGGRVDTGLVRLEPTPEEMKQVLGMDLFTEFRSRGRLFYLRGYIVREDAYTAARAETESE
jgi:hypothetical protein